MLLGADGPEPRFRASVFSSRCAGWARLVFVDKEGYLNWSVGQLQLLGISQGIYNASDAGGKTRGESVLLGLRPAGGWFVRRSLSPLPIHAWWTLDCLPWCLLTY